MLRILLIAGCACFCLANLKSGAAPATDSGFPPPIAIGRHWALLIDDYVVDRATGLDRVLHHPHPKGVVIPADKPWETTCVAPGFFYRRPDGTFVAFYSAIWWVPDPGNKEQPDIAQQYVGGTAYATSKDGIHWEKPNLGLTEAPTGIDWSKYPPLPAPTGSSKENNLGVPFGIRDMGAFGNVSDPAKRYSVSYAGKGYWASEIPDFIQDSSWTNKLTARDGTGSPRGKALDFWDDIHGEWVGIVQNAVPHWLPAREVARFASKDLVRWLSEIVLAADPADSHTPNCFDEPMGLSPFYSDGAVLGMLSWIHTDRSTPEGGPVLQKTPEYPAIWPWARKGPNDIRITISRDGGRTWDRNCSRQAWIPHGTEEDAYDRMVISPCVPVRVGDEDWFYMGVWNGDHLSTRASASQESYYSDRVRKGQIALYTQKHNRYVSLRAPSRPKLPVSPDFRPQAGRLSSANPHFPLITKPLLLDGKSLQLNVEANRGQVRVSIASAEPLETLGGTTLSTAPHFAEQNPLPGFSFDDCTPIRANSIEHTVQFKNGATLESLRGRPVRLLFEMIDAELYGFRVQ